MKSNFSRLTPTAAARLQHLTFGTYGAFLSQPEALCFAAYADADPVGLLVAGVHPRLATTRLLSLFVLPAYRRQGMGVGLVRALEEVARAQGDALLYTEYVAPKIALEGVLTACGWQPPEVSMELIEAPFAAIADILQQVYMPPLPENVTIFAWHDHTAADLAVLAARADEFAPALDPRNETELLTEGSVGVRVNGTLAGWVALHHLAPELLRATAFYLFPDVRLPQLWRHIILTAYNRQLAAYPYRNMVIPCVLPFARVVRRYIGNRIARTQHYCTMRKPLA